MSEENFIDMGELRREINLHIKDLAKTIADRHIDTKTLNSELRHILSGKVLEQSQINKMIVDGYQWMLEAGIREAIEESDINETIKGLVSEMLVDPEFIEKMKEKVRETMLSKIGY